ncbi:MAG: hypothetical protein QOF59_2167, partial [Actinomycetota bacterium]|nr:hypothetical protein [Actinomycetota bacterium]
MTVTPVRPVRPVTSVTLAVDVRDVAPLGVERIVADVFFPASDMLDAARAVVVCLPGGGMSRRYFDLRTPDGDNSYSMARYLAAVGLVVVI